MKKKVLKMLLLLPLIVIVFVMAVNLYVKLSVKDRIVSLEKAKSFDADAVLVLGCLVRGSTYFGILP